MPVIQCLVEDISFRNEANGWTVVRLKEGKDRFTAVGVVPYINEGEHVRVSGEWGEHPVYGRQLKIESLEQVAPEGKNDIERYLASGVIKGIGPMNAGQIVKQFGGQALDILDYSPERLTEIPGIGPKRARMIAESYAEQRETRQVMMFLQGHDISPALAIKIFKRFGMATQEIVKNNPYVLVDEIQGVGFKTADKIAYSMGISQQSDHRIQSGIKYVLGEAASSTGHMFLPLQDLIGSASRILSVDEQLIENQLSYLIVSRQVVSSDMGEYTAIYFEPYYEAEANVARMLTDMMAAAGSADLPDAEGMVSGYEREEGVTLSSEQRDAVITAVTSGISIITGGPGTGKTTGIKCIIHIMSRYGEVLLAAPTGRAAKRMSEATECEAKTIHRLLEFSGEDNFFKKNEDEPLDANMIIVDEMSMMDIFLMRSLLKALKPGARLVMVGDADQLPSVGAGNVLRDLIDSGVLPVVSLSKIFRQAGESMIVVNAHRINHGEPPVYNAKGGDFFFERKDSVSSTVDAAIQLITRRLPEYYGFNSLRDIQVLSPMKKGDAGVWRLNKLIQEALNPRTPGIPEWNRGEVTFRLGDKVMQVKNNYQLEWRRGSELNTGVYNGDVGFITGIDREDMSIEITFDDDRVAVYGEAELEELELAYCVSVHKSQGSEFPALVMPLYSGPPMLMTRNLLYTAVTRARKLVVLVGREECIDMMINNCNTKDRYSALGQRLIELGA